MDDPKTNSGDNSRFISKIKYHWLFFAALIVQIFAFIWFVVVIFTPTLTILNFFETSLGLEHDDLVIFGIILELIVFILVYLEIRVLHPRSIYVEIKKILE